MKGTYFGDANLDGEFNTGDLVSVLSAGQYEDTVPQNSQWATGDWDGDGEFRTSDLVVALADGGFEQGPRAAVSVVPEPTSILNLMVGLMMAAPIHRRWMCVRRRAGILSIPSPESAQASFMGRDTAAGIGNVVDAVGVVLLHPPRHVRSVIESPSRSSLRRPSIAPPPPVRRPAWLLL